MKLGLVLVTGLTLSGAACGGGSGNGSGFVSCTELELIPGSGMLELCIETSGAAASQLQQSCAQEAAAAAGTGITITFANAPCSHVDALGACRIMSGGIVEDAWYYKSGDADAAGYVGQTSADIQTICSGEGATFLPP